MQMIVLGWRRLIAWLRSGLEEAPPYPLCFDEWEFLPEKEVELAPQVLREAPTDAEFMEQIAALARQRVQPE